MDGASFASFLLVSVFLQILKPISLPRTSSRLQKKTCTVDRRFCVWLWSKAFYTFFSWKSAPVCMFAVLFREIITKKVSDIQISTCCCRLLSSFEVLNLYSVLIKAFFIQLFSLKTFFEVGNKKMKYKCTPSDSSFFHRLKELKKVSHNHLLV